MVDHLAGHFINPLVGHLVGHLVGDFVGHLVGNLVGHQVGHSYCLGWSFCSSLGYLALLVDTIDRNYNMILYHVHMLLNRKFHV